MITHPTAGELIESVMRFIEERAAPNLKDRDAFHARVAVNALAAVKRELEQGLRAENAAVSRLSALLGQNGDFEALNSLLCERIQQGALSPTDPQLLAHLRASLIDQVRIDQPNYSGLKTLQDA